jgi:hypothetical protein
MFDQAGVWAVLPYISIQYSHNVHIQHLHIPYHPKSNPNQIYLILKVKVNETKMTSNPSPTPRASKRWELEIRPVYCPPTVAV